MEDFELLIGLCVVAIVLTAAARRMGAPYPAFLALGGVVLALVPGVPRFALRPDLALALFVAPVLLDAAYDASPRDLKDNWAPLFGLVVGAVLLTTLAVAYVARAFEPTLPWAAAIALGAIVAPPDAAAATAVLAQVRPPRRIVTILEGESLLNDASALLIYRVAAGAAVNHGFSAKTLGPTFLLGIAASLVFGPVVARIYLPLVKRIEDTPSAILAQFVSTFGVWIIADRLGLSPVLAMVSYAIAIARVAPDLTPARLRVPAYAVWETVVFVANVLAFVLIGMQIRPVFEGLSAGERSRYLYVAAAVLVTVIVVRIAWVMSYNTAVRLKIRRFGFHPPRPMTAPSVQSGVAISWCGMRGVVTLAAALALPASADGTPFPFRNLIVLTAFSVVLGTLVLQGLTLKPLLRFLALRDDDPVGREVDLARERVFEAVMATMGDDMSLTVQAVREEYETLLQREVDEHGSGSEWSHFAREDAHRRALAAARHVMSALRANATIGDDAFHAIEEDLDRIEIATFPR
ncbi:MAG TPA: sodium:proton antiporter [Polyangiaceae bacterium]|nr:sodium:proton antiporter [Polyangiaceae bacterium]